LEEMMPVSEKVFRLQTKLMQCEHILQALAEMHHDLVEEAETLIAVLEREGLGSFSTSVAYRSEMLKRMLEEHKEKMS
jgi:hypothetical protein